MEKYQTFFPRFIALLIDSFIMVPLFVFDQWFREAELPHSFFYFWIPLSSLVFPAYSITMNAKFGQTLGKMWMKVKVLDVSENPLTIRQAMLRDTPQIIFSLSAIIIGIIALPYNENAVEMMYVFGIFNAVSGIWGLADIVVFLTNDKRRALHDLIAGTVVVKTES
jgi:uncharacterized RDD family membrane protein YckC